MLFLPHHLDKLLSLLFVLFFIRVCFFTGKVDFFKGLPNGCMTDAENESHSLLRQPWICFHKLAKSRQIGELSAMTFLI